jgi:Rieske Fe-S protein
VECREDIGESAVPNKLEGAQVSRRAWLERICGFLGWAGLQISETACGPEAQESAPRSGEVAVPLGSLKAGQRLTVIVAGNPVEVHRSATGVVARSLRCTHWGCVVRWRQEQRVYVCPCHEGRYDEDGAVLEGPPPAPLRTVAIRIAGGMVLVGAPVPSPN